MASRFFDKAPPRAGGGGLQSTPRERWRPELRGRQLPVPAEPESSGNQTIDFSVYTDYLIINYKDTLACQVVCMGVENLGLADLPQAGRLCHHLSNWLIITQDRWILNTVQGYLIDFVSEPHQQSPPNPPHCSSEQTNWSDSRGVDKAAHEAGDSTVGTPCGGRILVQHFPSSQKGRRAETSDKSQSPQPARKHRAFQDGGYPHGKGPVEASGLACQGGFEGRLLRNSHTLNPLEVSQISSPRENISLRVPTIRSVISPVGIHQNSEASLSPSSRDGHASCGLHRRHFDFGGVQGDGPRSGGSLSVSVGVPGLCNQQREISTCSEPDHRISGPDRRLSQHGASSPASKNENDLGGVPEIVEGTSYLGSRLSPSTGENGCNRVCGSPSSSLLSPPANGAIQRVRGERAELRFSSEFAHGMSRGAELVGHPDVQMEREIDSQDRDRLDYRLRRIPERLGSPLSPPINRRPMVGRGKKDAHQLPGASGCHSSSQLICKTQIQNFNSAED